MTPLSAVPFGGVMSFLYFLPDESAGAAVEDPPVETPIVETPEPPEAEPPAEQEQAPEGDEPEEADSGAEQAEDKAEGDTLDLALDEIVKDPEAAEKLRARLGVAEKPVDDERYTWELEQSQNQRQAVWNQAQATYNQFEPNAVSQSLTTFFTDLNDGVKDAATKLQNGDISSPDGVAFSVADVVQALTPYFERGRNAGQGLSRAAGHYTGFEGLEQDASHRLLTTEERVQFATFRQQNNLTEAQKLQLQAAGRGPSADAIKAEAKADAEKQVGTLAQAEKVMSLLQKNGKVQTGDAPKKGPSTREEVEEALRSGPTADIDKNLAKLEALG